MPFYNNSYKTPSYTPTARGIDASRNAVTIPNTTVNTFGAWTSVYTTTSDVDELILMIYSLTINTGVLTSLELRYNGTTSIISGLTLICSQYNMTYIRVPVKVPAGVLIEARCAAATASRTLSLSIMESAASTGIGATVATPLAPVTSSPGSTGVALVIGDTTTPGTWAALNSGAATTGLIKGFMICAGWNNDTTRSIQTINVTVGTGSAGSQTPLFLIETISASNNITQLPFGPLMVDVPAGTLLWVKADGSTVTSGGDSMNVQVIALYQ